MRIAQVAPLAESVPPQLYGGTERVVAFLTDELVRRGHDVTLFATGDSHTTARLVPAWPRALRLDGSCQDPFAPHLLMLEEVAKLASRFDVVHFHVSHFHFPVARRLDTPHLTTLHGRLDMAELRPLYREFQDVPVVSISDAQRHPLPEAHWLGTVHHGLPLNLLSPRYEPGRYLAFIGRVSPEKRLDRAIAIASACGQRLRVAAKVDPADREYFEREIRELLNNPLVDFVGEIAEQQKNEFLGGATALLFPIDWPEPFGLVMIEALACGVPVVAFRGGSVSEVIDDGATGFVVDTLEDAVDATRQVHRLNRRTCRAVFERRFNVERMAGAYLRLYKGSSRAGVLNPDEHRNRVMTDTLSLEQPFAIVSGAGQPTAPLRVLKHGDTFAVFDPHGDIVATASGAHGLYHAGTRFLSRFELRLDKVKPLLLSSTTSTDNVVFTADLTNPDVVEDGRIVLEHGALHIYRSRIVSNGSWIECLRVTNYSIHPIRIPLCLRIDADFVDVFEVRGTRRLARGRRFPSVFAPDQAILSYRGLDNVERRTIVRPLRAPDEVDKGTMIFQLALEPHATGDVEIAVSCTLRNEQRPLRRYGEAVSERRQQVATQQATACSLTGANQAFNLWLQRSSADLQMMLSETPYGAYPYAGIPWFSTPFGRDGLITAFSLLWAAPDVARGVLTFLAATQATARNDAQDAQPGKILHEMRDGEMATLGGIPFGRYYGTADATPLFVALAWAYFERTNDASLIDRLWPHLLAALDWMDRYGDADQDGFIEYARRTGSGLVHQGWKDSGDAIFHADGSLASPPIALCEIQGYAWAAWGGASKLATARGHTALAAQWQQRAVALEKRFEEAFWCEELGTYALALDADKQQCRVRTSNPGHCLFTGIASPLHAQRVSETLMADHSFSGWGVRTVASGAARYNPMSYHNGSVWPHDNAIVAAGLARYGFTRAAARVFEAMFDLSQAVDLRRLPELICGFHRRTGDSPTLYPVACAPQAWSSGAVYLLVQACLGLRIDAQARRVSLERAVLPEKLEWLRIENLSVGASHVDLLLTRHANDVGVSVLRRDGEIEIVSVS